MNKKELRDWHIAQGNLTQAEADMEDIVMILVGGDSHASLWTARMVIAVLVLLIGICSGVMYLL